MSTAPAFALSVKVVEKRREFLEMGVTVKQLSVAGHGGGQPLRVRGIGSVRAHTGPGGSPLRGAQRKADRETWRPRDEAQGAQRASRSFRESQANRALVARSFQVPVGRAVVYMLSHSSRIFWRLFGPCARIFVGVPGVGWRVLPVTW